MTLVHLWLCDHRDCKNERDWFDQDDGHHGLPPGWVQNAKGEFCSEACSDAERLHPDRAPGAEYWESVA